MASKEYAKKCVEMARSSPNAIGVVAQSRLDDVDYDHVQFTPGVQVNSVADQLGQQYKTPAKAIIENGADVIIVGRGIITADDPKAKAQEYKKVGWTALKNRTSDVS